MSLGDAKAVWGDGQGLGLLSRLGEVARGLEVGRCCRCWGKGWGWLRRGMDRGGGEGRGLLSCRGEGRDWSCRAEGRGLCWTVAWDSGRGRGRGHGWSEGRCYDGWLGEV